MLHIIWLILKIIGIVLLALLCLLLLLVLLVLLVPVRYRAAGSRYDEVLQGAAGISWLLHIFSVSADYCNELQVTFRIFGIPIRQREPAGENDIFEESPDEAEEDDTELVSAQSLEETKLSEAETEESETTASETTEEFLKEQQTKPKKPPQSEQRQKKSAGPHKKRPSFLKRLFEKVRFSFMKICDKLKHIGEKKAQLKAMYDDEANREMLRLVLKQFKRLIRHILPTKLKGSVKFGFDDPSQTGQILMYISPFYGFYGRNLTVCPSFEEKILEGELELKGRIRVGTLVMIAIALIRNRRFRTSAKRFMA